MKSVTWTDANGLKHRSLVRNTDSDSAGPMGIRQDPPDLDRIDWEGVRRDIHNRLVEAGILTWTDFQRGDIRGIILGALQRRLQTLYREVETNE